jgi:hypothetical protein
LAGDELDRVEPVGGERAADEAVLQQQPPTRVPRLRMGRASREQQSRSVK